MSSLRVQLIKHPREYQSPFEYMLIYEISALIFGKHRPKGCAETEFHSGAAICSDDGRVTTRCN